MRESWLMELAERFINDPTSRTKIGRMGAKEVIAEIHADLGLRSDGKSEHNRIAVLSVVLPNTSGYQDGQSRPASRSDAEEGRVVWAGEIYFQLCQKLHVQLLKGHTLGYHQ